MLEPIFLNPSNSKDLTSYYLGIIASLQLGQWKNGSRNCVQRDCSNYSNRLFVFKTRVHIFLSLYRLGELNCLPQCSPWFRLQGHPKTEAIILCHFTHCIEFKVCSVQVWPLYEFLRKALNSKCSLTIIFILVLSIQLIISLCLQKVIYLCFLMVLGVSTQKVWWKLKKPVEYL